MKFSFPKTSALVTAIGVALLISACGSNSSPQASASAPMASSSSSNVSITTANGAYGAHLIGSDGRPLYLWVADTGGKSVCSGVCAKDWPPLLTKGTPRVGAGVNASNLGTTTRSGGAKQVTYMGHPLYYYIADKSAGAITGQGSDNFGAKWWLVAPSGSAITTVKAGAPSAPSY